ncbi:MAG TPA: hypothetical protein VLQ45_22080, partial [Thermoanaerobaculia bacterium]|nr:hypothetical protein [Thermoanaerobaculia bacterium]
NLLTRLADERDLYFTDWRADWLALHKHLYHAIKDAEHSTSRVRADSDEAGHPFRREGGHPFRGEGGHPAGRSGEQGSWWIEVAALRPANGL